MVQSNKIGKSLLGVLEERKEGEEFQQFVRQFSQLGNGMLMVDKLLLPSFSISHISLLYGFLAGWPFFSLNELSIKVATNLTK